MKLLLVLVLGSGLAFAATPQVAKQPFLWGVSNSSFQVEGAEPKDSDWLRWTKTPGKIRDGSNADRATDFWNRYEEDFKLAQDAGLNAFRMSIAWERIQPARGQWDERALAHYEKIIESMRKFGLEPVVTLHHFVLPGWVADDGGLLSKTFVADFTAYADKVVNRLSLSTANVHYWMTFNEPEILVRGGFLTGDWPPGFQDTNKAAQAFAQLARAHIEAVRAIRAHRYAEVKVSVAKNWQVFEMGDANPLSFAAMKLLDGIYNQQFLQALHTGKLNIWMPGATRIKETIALPGGRSTLDYLGVNNYGRWLVKFTTKAPYYTSAVGPGDKNDLGWEIYPKAIYKVIQAASAYKVPVLVSENGLADAKDQLRAKFLTDHMEWIEKARADGYPVIGYLHWSLTDNFEWAYGLTPRFGLVEIDYATGKRSPRPSFGTYAGLVLKYKKLHRE